MAHYAKLGINNKVIAVHVVADKDCQTQMVLKMKK